MSSTSVLVRRYDSRSVQIREYKSILYATLVSVTKNYKYPTERAGLLKHRYNQYRNKISLCSHHGITENRLNHLLCSIKVVTDNHYCF